MRTIRYTSWLLAVLLTAAGCNNEQASSGGQAPPPPEVGVAQVISKPVQQWDEYTGRISAIDTVELRPRASGYVQRVAYKEGQDVKQGDLMFLIDPRPYRAALENAQAQLARARVAQQLETIRNKRAQALIDDNAISHEELDLRRAAQAQSAADVHAAEAAVATAKLNLSFTEVRAPVSGRASRALVTVGNLATADDTLLTTVVSQDPMYVYFDADENSYLRYKEQERKNERSAQDNAVHVGLANEAGYPHSGRVDFLDTQVNPTLGTVRARAVLPNPDRIFTPGLFARVQFVSGQKAQALLIDDKAILTDQDRKYVYAVDKDGKAQRKDIVLGGVVDGLRVVQSGLAPDDRIVVVGLQKVFYPGMPVTPAEVPMDKPSAPAAPQAMAGK
ncbi:MAG: efflux RND transporter periplasmic adaptor subunit [Nitrospira sp.]|nr:efflux RND transporter periplasmic adaptor subunit [Nitrospira sp.]MCW5795735.1 efflux RND transporter periplasmic adaptor subunit [Nitrospira sp.]HMV56595.1 efflux RND transporter periplasmic adaptor subunit [Nitrospira sp.]HNA48043.1 efflux RND transporter periplasmic adaptor subunit [Nitrospira sp.]HNC82833.1 efflux RND transporter periplasmic adaptor subunit [Nitrospira sp.]